MFSTIPKKAIILSLISISVFFPAYSEIVGGFFFQGKDYTIEKKGDYFSVEVDGKEEERFGSLYSYGSDGEKLAVFLTENTQIVWFDEKKIRLEVNPSVFYKQKFPVFENFFVQRGDKKLVFVAHCSPYLLNPENGKKYFPPSLVFPENHGLKIVSPEKIFVFGEKAFYYSSKRFIVFSLKDNKVSELKKLTYSILNFADFSENSPSFFFDENNYEVIYRGNGFKEKGRTTKKGIYFYKGRIGGIDGFTVKAEFSTKGLSSDFQLKIKVNKGKKVFMDRVLSGFSLTERDLLDVSKPHFYPLEKAVVLTIPGGYKLVFFFDGRGKLSLKIFEKKVLFYISNGVPRSLNFE